MRQTTRLFMALAMVSFLVCTQAQAEGIVQFARRLDRSGGLFHDRTASREVVFRSSGRATKAAAIRAWRNSPGHAALLPSIRRIVCTGNVCVGR